MSSQAAKAERENSSRTQCPWCVLLSFIHTLRECSLGNYYVLEYCDTVASRNSGNWSALLWVSLPFILERDLIREQTTELETEKKKLEKTVLFVLGASLRALRRRPCLEKLALGLRVDRYCRFKPRGIE